jgi:hypothetical protein
MNRGSSSAIMLQPVIHYQQELLKMVIDGQDELFGSIVAFISGTGRESRTPAGDIAKGTGPRSCPDRVRFILSSSDR